MSTPGLLPAQTMFLKSQSYGTVMIGGIGTGKSVSLGYAAIRDCLNGYRTAIFSITYRNLRDVNFPETKMCLERMGLVAGLDYRFYSQEMKFNIRGQELLFRSIDEPDKIRGLTLSRAYLDEMREAGSRKPLDIIFGRLRGPDPRWGGVTSTNGYDWVWEHIRDQGLDHVFADTQTPISVTNDSTTIIRCRTSDNWLLPQSYETHLRSQYTSLFARQELDAEIVEIEGGLIKEEWFIQVPWIRPKSGVRFWDLAVTDKIINDSSSGALLYNSGDKICISDVKVYKLKWPDLRKKIIDAAIEDGSDIHIGIERAGQQQAIIDDLRREPALRKYVIRAERPRGDKLARALPWISQAELGFVQMARGSWNKEFLVEAKKFSGSGKERDDQIDSVSGAYDLLVNKSFIRAGRVAY